MKKKFNDIYRFPLRVCDSLVYVWTDNGVMAFNNLVGFDKEGEKCLNELIAAINGDKPGVYDATAENGRILVNGKKALLARGWGHLTGGGALNLPLDMAAKIQDDFIAFCVSQLRRDLKEDIE